MIAVERDPLAKANKLERAYARELEVAKRLSIIRSWDYEAIRIKLADGAWYTPDFLVVAADGAVEIHETKGFMREAARVRLLVAKERFPARFFLVKRNKMAWEVSPV